MAGMPTKEIDEVLAHAARHGVRVTPTTKGHLLRFADGSSTMLHRTGSDHRERLNVRARFKRAGIPWIDDGDELSARITEAPPLRPGTLRKVERLLLHWEQDTISASKLMHYAAEQGEKLAHSTANVALYQLGWKATGKTTKRRWRRPIPPETNETNTKPTPVAPAVMFAPPAEVTPIRPEPEVQSVNGREFIDSVPSWCATLEQIPGDMTVSQLLGVVQALGLDLELRTWKRDAS